MTETTKGVDRIRTFGDAIAGLRGIGFADTADHLEKVAGRIDHLESELSRTRKELSEAREKAEALSVKWDGLSAGHAEDLFDDGAHYAYEKCARELRAALEGT